MTTRTTWTWSWTQKTLVVCYFFAAVAVTSSHAQQRQAEEDCLSVVENVVNLCGGVLDSTDPFDLLNCCTEAQSANERKCFCDSSVALGLGSIYDVTLQVLDSGCEISLATYGSVECVAENYNREESSKESSVEGKHGLETSNDIDPVAFWTFDDVPNSNVASDTAGKTNGLYSAGVDLGHEGQTSKQSSAYFNGESSYVVIPYTPLLNSADFTISATVNPSARSGEDQSESAESIVENFAETSEQTVVIGGYGLERHWIGPNEKGAYEPKWAFAIGTPLGPRVIYSKSKARSDEWSQIVGVYDTVERRMSLFVNGKLEASETLGNQVMLGNPENDMLIGNGNRLISSGGSTVPYVGYIAQVSYFDEPLGEDEIETLYEYTFPASSNKKGGKGKLPLWAIILIASLSVLTVLGIASGLLVWRIRARKDSLEYQNTPQRSSNRTQGDLPDKLTPLYEEEREELTPKATTPSSSVHPRFKKIGSRISVTWN